MPEPTDTIEREMSATPDEVRRSLGLAFPGRTEERNGLFRVDNGQAVMEIEFEVLEPRVIALLSLPRMKVRLRGTAGSNEERAALLARMDLAMQRGGG